MALFTRTIQSLALLLFGVLIAVILLEAGVRLFNLDKQNLPTWHDRPSKYYYFHNASDARNFQPIQSKQQNTYRIAVVGDSFTFAPYMQAEDSFVMRLQRLLQYGNYPNEIEVINYGIPSYSTANEVALVEQALEQSADLIILQITLNDPELKPLTPTKLSQANEFKQPEFNSKRYRIWRTARLVAMRIHNMRSIEEYKDYFFSLWERPLTFNYFTNALDQINNLAIKNNTPIVAVVFPLFGFPNDDNYPFFPIHEKLAKTLNDRNIPYLDLFNSYRNIPLDRLVVLPGRDRHPNEIAHRIAAENLYEWLKVSNYLPADMFTARVTNSRVSVLFNENQQVLNLE